MDLLRWMGRMYARFVAVSIVILSAWMFAINLGDRGWDSWVQAWILASGLIGTAGGVVYILSLDGAEVFRTKRFRIFGWTGMLLAVLLPTALTFMLVPMVLLLVPSLFRVDAPQDGTVTSA